MIRLDSFEIKEGDIDFNYIIESFGIDIDIFQYLIDHGFIISFGISYKNKLSDILMSDIPASYSLARLCIDINMKSKPSIDLESIDKEVNQVINFCGKSAARLNIELKHIIKNDNSYIGLIFNNYNIYYREFSEYIYNCLGVLNIHHVKKYINEESIIVLFDKSYRDLIIYDIIHSITNIGDYNVEYIELDVYNKIIRLYNDNSSYRLLVYLEDDKLTIYNKSDLYKN